MTTILSSNGVLINSGGILLSTLATQIDYTLSKLISILDAGFTKHESNPILPTIDLISFFDRC